MKHFERSTGLDTALYKNYLFISPNSIDLFLRPVLKQTCPSERIISHLCMNRAINLSINTSFVSRCRQNG